MKPIGLSDLQRDHLLEMCNKLFPEYKREHFNSWEFGEDDYGMIEFLMYEKNKELKAIHWFEFVTTYILDKLYPDNNKQTSGSIDITDKEIVLSCIFIDKAHPVDYLYEQFLKIK